MTRPLRIPKRTTEPASYCVVFAATPHWQFDHWHVCGVGPAVAREEREKLVIWGVEAIDTHGTRVVLVAAETQGRWRPAVVAHDAGPQPPSEDGDGQGRPGADAAQMAQTTLAPAQGNKHNTNFMQVSQYFNPQQVIPDARHVPSSRSRRLQKILPNNRALVHMETNFQKEQRVRCKLVRQSTFRNRLTLSITPAFWTALRGQSVSEQFIKLLKKMYGGHTATVINDVESQRFEMWRGTRSCSMR